MEYALGTIWLADAGEDAVDVLNRRLQGSHGKLLVDLGDLDLDASFLPRRSGPSGTSWVPSFSRIRTNGALRSGTC
jgi:hypothetical protein